MGMTPNGRSRGLLPRRAIGFAAVAALLPLAACNLDEALTINDPYTVTPPVARDTTNLLNTFAGARAQFAIAMGGRWNREGGLVLQSGTFTDELVSSDNFGTRNAIDRREPTEVNSAVSDPYSFLQRARAEAVNAADLFSTTSQNGSYQHIDLYNVVGYSELLLAETFCSGVPLSLVDVSGQFQTGPQQSTAALLDSAIAAFDQAISMVGSSSDPAKVAELNLARVGKARALLFAGRYADAAAVAAQVPTAFHYEIEYSGETQTTNNVVNEMLNGELRYSAVDNEGENGLPYLSSFDPRVPWGEGSAADSATYDTTSVAAPDQKPHVMQQKYPDVDRPIILASGMEARYIQAEAALKAGSPTFLTLLNEARAANNQFIPGTANDLTPLATAGVTQEEQLRTLMRERAYSLWLTAHRLGDMRRMVRPVASGGWGLDPLTVYPTGVDRRGEQYGNDLVFTIPVEERNNLQFSGCQNMNP